MQGHQWVQVRGVHLWSQVVHCLWVSEHVYLHVRNLLTLKDLVQCASLAPLPRHLQGSGLLLLRLIYLSLVHP